jgi:hypothetical protein
MAFALREAKKTTQGEQAGAFSHQYKKRAAG